MRGVPLITVLFMANVMLPLFLPPGVDLRQAAARLIGVALFSAAYMAEVVRGGLQAMPKGQYEGAQALGLELLADDAFRHPAAGLQDGHPRHRQLLHLAVQGHIAGRDHRHLRSSRASIEASNNDPNWATPVTSHTGYAFAALFYWVFCFGMSRYSLWVERRLDTGHKR